MKFVDRYGVDAHWLLAAVRYLPALHYFGFMDGTQMSDSAEPLKCGLYVGPLWMAVMDFVEGQTARDAEDRRTWPKDVLGTFSKALAMLHQEGNAFGDLRQINQTSSSPRTTV